MTNLLARLSAADGPSRELDFWCWWYMDSTEAKKPNPQAPPADYVEANIRKGDAPRYDYKAVAAALRAREAG